MHHIVNIRVVSVVIVLDRSAEYIVHDYKNNKFTFPTRSTDEFLYFRVSCKWISQQSISGMYVYHRFELLIV